MLTQHTASKFGLFSVLRQAFGPITADALSSPMAPSGSISRPRQAFWPTQESPRIVKEPGLAALHAPLPRHAFGPISNSPRPSSHALSPLQELPNILKGLASFDSQARKPWHAFGPMIPSAEFLSNAQAPGPWHEFCMMIKLPVVQVQESFCVQDPGHTVAIPEKEQLSGFVQHPAALSSHCCLT